VPLLPPFSLGGGLDGAGARLACGAAMLFLLVTTLLLIFDLKRPERFLYILLHGNPGSWITRGAWILGAYGALVAGWLAVLAMPPDSPRPGAAAGLVLLTAAAAAATAAYTAWLFGQAHGRVLWLRRGLALELLAHAVVAGAGLLLLLHPRGGGGGSAAVLRATLAAALVVHGLLLLGEAWRAPRGRAREYARAARLLTHGPFARTHWLVGLGAGIVAPLLLLAFDSRAAWDLAAMLSLAALALEQHALVRAGQALPIS